MHNPSLIRLSNRDVNTSGRAGGQPADDPTQSRAHSEPRAGTRGRVDEVTVRAATFSIDRPIRRRPSLDPACLLNTFPPLNVVKQCHTQRAGAGAPYVERGRIILKQNISPLGRVAKSLCHRCGSSHTVRRFKRSRFRRAALSESGVRNASPIPRIAEDVELQYKRTMLTEGQKPRKPPSKDTKGTETKQTENNMQLSHLSLLCLGLLVNLQVFRSHPVNTGLGGNDIDLLKVSLRSCHCFYNTAVEFDYETQHRQQIL